MPSILAKQGVAFTSGGRLNLYRGVYKLAEAAVDPRLRLRDLRPVLARLPPPPDQGRRAARLAAPHAPQPALLPRPHGRRCGGTSSPTRSRPIATRNAPSSAGATTSIPRWWPPRRRRRRDDAALDALRASAAPPQGHASVVHRASGEIMHGGPRSGGRGEALYVEQSRLRERLREPTSDAAGGVGRRARRRAQRHGRRSVPARREPAELQRPVHLVSFEHDVASLRLALRNAGQLPAPALPRPGARPALRRMALGSCAARVDAARRRLSLAPGRRPRRPTASSTIPSRR